MALARILITGGAGFLGSHLARSFHEHGVATRILDAAEQPEWTRETPVEYMRGDVRDAAVVGQALTGVDAVIHSAFASPRMAPEAIRSVNVDGARVTCEQAVQRGVRRLILISSTIVDRPARVHPLFRSAALNSMDRYRQSRAEAERVAREMGGGDLRVALVRPKTFVGPGRVSAFTIIFDWIRLGKPVLLLGPAGYVVLTMATAPTLLPLLLTGVLTFVGIGVIGPKPV